MTRIERVALSTLALVVVGATLASVFAPHEGLALPEMLGARLLPPMSRDPDGGWHLAGTDRFGRDVLLRMLVAARLSLLVGLLGALSSAAIGSAVGAIAGWRRGATDTLLMAVADAGLAIPRLILLLACAALWQPGAITTVVVLAATGWMGVARLLRAEVIGIAQRPFAEAARALGARPSRVLWRHVVPQAAGAVLVATSLGVGNAILLESGLSFLGLGVQPPAPSWGNMIAGGRDLLLSAPWVAIAPGLLLIVTVTCCTLLGDAVEARLRGAAIGPAPSRSRVVAH